MYDKKYMLDSVNKEYGGFKMQTIREYMEYNCQGNFENIIVYDCDKEEDIFKGLYYDLPNELEYKQVGGWELQVHDNEAYICFNV